ncbi:MAG: hypothetical protein V1732_00320 [Patescibacteria group bacterium]
MNEYIIEQRIKTSADLGLIGKGGINPYFEYQGVHFKYSDFYNSGWGSGYWIAKFEIQAKRHVIAYDEFKKLMNMIIPRLAFSSQCYFSFIHEPFIIMNKSNFNRCLFKYSYDNPSLNRLYTNEDLAVFYKLISENKISDEFYCFWLDAINTIGYSSKLLLMFAAVESLTKNLKSNLKSKLRENIFGKKLKEEIYKHDDGNKNNKMGLRHRISHGYYFKNDKEAADYFNQVQNSVISYINKTYFSCSFDEKNIKTQRNHFESKMVFYPIVIEKISKNANLCLINILSEVEKMKDDKSILFKFIVDSNAGKIYQLF